MQREKIIIYIDIIFIRLDNIQAILGIFYPFYYGVIH